MIKRTWNISLEGDIFLQIFVTNFVVVSFTNQKLCKNVQISNMEFHPSNLAIRISFQTDIRNIFVVTFVSDIRNSIKQRRKIVHQVLGNHRKGEFSKQTSRKNLFNVFTYYIMAICSIFEKGCVIFSLVTWRRKHRRIKFGKRRLQI